MARGRKDSSEMHTVSVSPSTGRYLSTDELLPQAKPQLSIEYTRPDRLLRHDISDEELEMLSGARRDGMSEALWAMIGAAIASLPSAGEAIYKAYLAPQAMPLTEVHLLEIVVFVGAVAAAVSIAIFSSKRGQTSTGLVETIRARSAR
jgi:hypothetical protein